MRITTNTGDLVTSLKKLAALPGSAVPGPEQYVSIDASAFEGLNFSRTGNHGKVSFDCFAEVHDEGSVVIGFNLFYRILGAMQKGMVEITTEGTLLFVRGANGEEFEIPIVPDDDSQIPPLVLKKVTHSVTFETKKLVDWLKRTCVAVRLDPENVDLLGGVAFRSHGSKLSIFATDRRRILLYETGIEQDGIDVMLPAAMVDAVCSMFGGFDGKIIVEFDERAIQFAGHGGRYVAPKAVKVPPNISQIVTMASEPTKVSRFDRDSMIAAVNTAMPLSQNSGELKSITLRFIEDGIQISAAALNSKYKQTISASGEEFQVELNAALFSEWLQAAEPGVMQIGFLASNNAICCQTVDYTLFLSTLKTDKK